MLPPITSVPPRPSDIGTVPIVTKEPPGTTVSLPVAVGKCTVGGWRTTAKPVGLIVTTWPPIVTTSVAEDPLGSLRVLVPITRVPEIPNDTGVPPTVTAGAPGRIISVCLMPAVVNVLSDIVVKDADVVETPDLIS